MKPLSADTHPRAEAVHIALMRAATPSKRLALARSMSAATINRSRGALKRARPHASNEELDIWFVELNYGKELADNLKLFLAQRARR